MAIELVAKAYTLDLTPAEQRILLVLCDMANHNGYCWPSIGLIAWKINMSRRTVERSIQSMEERGGLRVFRKSGRASLYQVRLDRFPEKPPYRPTREELQALKNGPDAETYDILTQVQPEEDGPTYDKMTHHLRQNDAPPTTPVSHVTVKEPQRETSDAPKTISEPKKKPRKRPIPIPEDFTPEAKYWTALQEELRVSDAWMNRETTKFRDYWTSRGKPMADWQAAWRNWIYKALEYANGNGNGGGGLAVVSMNPSGPTPIPKKKLTEGAGNPLEGLFQEGE